MANNCGPSSIQVRCTDTCQVFTAGAMTGNGSATSPLNVDFGALNAQASEALAFSLGSNPMAIATLAAALVGSNALTGQLPIVRNSPLIGNGTNASPLDISIAALSAELLAYGGFAGVAADANNAIVGGTGGLPYLPATIPVQLTCRPTASTYPTIAQVAAWVQKGVQWSFVDLIGVSNDCTRMITASDDATVTAHYAAAIAGRNNAVGAPNAIVSGLANENNGTASFVTGESNQSLTTHSLVAGRGSVLDGARSVIAGDGNQVTVGGVNVLVVGSLNVVSSGSNLIGGSQNEVSGIGGSIVAGALNIMTGQRGVLAGNSNQCAAGSAIVAGDSNVVEATANYGVIIGTQHLVSGYGAMVGGSQNTVAGVHGLCVGLQNVVAGNRNIVGGQSNTIAGANCLAIGSTNSIGAGTLQSAIMGIGNVCNVNRALVLGAYVQAVEQHSITLGYAAVGPAATSHRTIELLGANGNIRISGSLSSSYVFPGFGEHFLNPLDVPAARFATTDDGLSIRLCKDGEDFLGVTRRELAMSAGGGIDPDNSPWMLDAYGNRLMQTAETIEHRDIGPVEDVVSTISADGDGLGNTITTVEAAAVRAINREYIEADGRVLEVVRSAILVPVPNPDYRPDVVLPKMGVEFLGRTFVDADETVAPGDFVTSAADGRATRATGPTRARALAVNGGVALVLIR